MYFIDAIARDFLGDVELDLGKLVRAGSAISLLDVGARAAPAVENRCGG